MVDPKLDMTHCWQPTAEGYFGRVSKGLILESRARRHRPRRSGQDRQLQEDAMAKRAEALLARESLAPYLPPLTVAAGWLRLKSRSQCRAGALPFDCARLGFLRDPDPGVMVQQMSHGGAERLVGVMLTLNLLSCDRLRAGQCGQVLGCPSRPSCWCAKDALAASPVLVILTT